jgi:hypothetical protein
MSRMEGLAMARMTFDRRQALAAGVAAGILAPGACSAWAQAIAFKVGRDLILGPDGSHPNINGNAP